MPTPASTVPATLLLFGAGGHARVVADAALAGGAAGLVASDRDAQRCRGELLAGVPLRLPGDASLAGLPVHVAIGDNAAREREAGAWGHARLATVAHPRAAVSASAQVEPGCFIAAGAVVGPGAHVAAGAIVNHGAVVDHDAQLGAFCHVAPNATLGGAARVGRRALVGAGAVVLPGIEVGDDVVVGAGAVVNRPLSEPGTYAGVPARRIA